MNSILTSIKNLLDVQEDYEAFDSVLIMHINSVIFILYQLGIGPQDAPFSISDKSATWEDYLGEHTARLQGVVSSYISHKVKLMWDNSTMSGASMEALKAIIAEDEWRVNVEIENLKHEEVSTNE